MLALELRTRQAIAARDIRRVPLEFMASVRNCVRS
jgi:hypothetical protein